MVADLSAPDAAADTDASAEAGGAGGTAGAGGSGAEAGAAGSAGAAGAGGTGVTTCAFETGSGACDQCMNASCYDSCSACGAGTECAAFVSCALACASTDAACMQDCMSQHAGGVDEGLALVGPAGCLRTACNAACIVQGQLCSLSMGSDACDQCVAGSCMAECSTCADNDSCVALVDCAKGCSPDDQACIIGCGASNPGGISDANAFAGTGGCVEKLCAVACNGAPAQCAIQVGDAACDACIASKCLAPCNACADNDACVALLDCAKSCAPDDQACINDCAMQNPTGIAQAQGFYGSSGCVQEKCPGECGMGSSDCTLETGNAGCDQCLRTQCTGSCSTCSANPDCVALVACAAACDPNDIGCAVQCAADYPNGVQDAGPLIGPNGCVDADCSYWCP